MIEGRGATPGSRLVAARLAPIPVADRRDATTFERSAP